jgi:hypothetical protein
MVDSDGRCSLRRGKFEFWKMMLGKSSVYRAVEERSVQVGNIDDSNVLADSLSIEM